MAAPSDSELYRLNDDEADGEDNAAPTKVGPMSKAFVDQLMFKANLAETIPPSAKVPSKPPESAKPESGSRSRPDGNEISTVRPKAPAAADDDAIPSFSEEEDLSESTVLSSAAIPPEARPNPSPDPASKPPRVPSAALPAVPPALPSAALRGAPPAPPASPAASAVPVSGPPASSSAPAAASVSSAAPPPLLAVPPPAVTSDASSPSMSPVPFVEPALSVNAARYMAASSVYPPQQDAPRDNRFAIQVAVVIGALLLGTIAAIVLLFP